jgi:transcriptional regulator with XRE-family HTH domain
MGSPRLRPARLAEKLLQIRTALGLSQTQLLYELGVEGLIEYKRISDYELDKAEPSSIVLLRYARAANIEMEVLVDDELDLPKQLGAQAKRKRTASHAGRRLNKH